jgi:hypothetical protein
VRAAAGVSGWCGACGGGDGGRWPRGAARALTRRPWVTPAIEAVMGVAVRPVPGTAAAMLPVIARQGLIAWRL